MWHISTPRRPWDSTSGPFTLMESLILTHVTYLDTQAAMRQHQRAIHPNGEPYPHSCDISRHPGGHETAPAGHSPWWRALSSLMWHISTPRRPWDSTSGPFTLMESLILTHVTYIDTQAPMRQHQRAIHPNGEPYPHSCDISRHPGAHETAPAGHSP